MTDDILDVAVIEAVFDKGDYAAAYSGFEGAEPGGAALHGWLAARGVTAVDVAGLATDHCVRATALDAARAGRIAARQLARISHRGSEKGCLRWYKCCANNHLCHKRRTALVARL